MKFTHTTILVHDQEEALAFFTQKLGLEKRDDVAMESERWLTVGCKGQPNLEIVLQACDWGKDRATPEERKQQIGKQWLGWHSDNIHQDHERLKAKGVKIMQQPSQRPYGMEMIFEDLYGNVHLMVQPN